MASQQVRNMINNQIDSLLVRAETELRNEGNKKLIELQNELMTPETILKALKVDVNSTSCSASGLDKYEKVRQKLLTKITWIKKLLGNAKEKLEGIDGKVRPIIKGEGVVGSINDLKNNIIDPIIMPVLKALSLAIPIALFILKGPIADGFMSTELRQILVDAKTKIKECIDVSCKRWSMMKSLQMNTTCSDIFSKFNIYLKSCHTNIRLEY